VREAIMGSAAVLVAASGLLLIAEGVRVGSAKDESAKTAPPATSTGIGAPEASADGEISVRVVYFGMPAAVTGAKQETVELDSPACLTDLERSLAVSHPGLRDMLPTMLFLVDGSTANGSTPLRQNCEVDVLAAAAGG